jgi:hypothetical protein
MIGYVPREQTRRIWRWLFDGGIIHASISAIHEFDGYGAVEVTLNGESHTVTWLRSREGIISSFHTFSYSFYGHDAAYSSTRRASFEKYLFWQEKLRVP